MQNKVTSPHDMFIVEMLANEEITRELIVKHVPREITRHLNLDSLDIKSESYTDELKRAFTDIIVKLRLKHGHEPDWGSSSLVLQGNWPATT